MNTPCGDREPHAPHPHGDLEWCDGGSPDDGKRHVLGTTTSLLSDLEAALVANGTTKVCKACKALAAVSEEARAPLASAMAGTIGINKLDVILARNGHAVGRRDLKRHREEGHSQ